MHHKRGQMDQAIILINKLLDHIDYIQGAYDRGWEAEDTVKEAEVFLERINE